MLAEHHTPTWLHSLFADARFAFRQLHKATVFASVASLTLALGIGANTAIFSVVNSVLLRALPFSHPSQLVYISSRSTVFDFPYLGLSLPDIADLRSMATSYSAIAVSEDLPRELSGTDKPLRLESSAVSEDFFPLLGLHPLLGHTFTSADMQQGSRSVLLSESLWRDSFGAAHSAVGKTITLDEQPFTIIGVMPALPPLGFETDSKLWTAFIPTPEQLADRSNHAYSVLARLQPHTSLPRAQSELDTISSRLASAYPNADKGWTIHVTFLGKFLLGDVRTPLLVLFSAVGFVLLIACANVSNLFLARCWARRREFAIRSAMGASRFVLIRQLAIEALLIALIGGACAFLAAMWTLNGLRALLPRDVPRISEVQIDTSVAWFTVAASLFAVLLSALAPALTSTRDSLSNAIKPDASPGSSASPNLLRQLLVIGEISLAVVLLIGSALTLRSFAQFVRLDLGFHPDHVLTMRMDFPKFRFTSAESAIAYIQQLLHIIRGTPGVTSASAGMVYPMSDEVGETTFVTETTFADPRHSQQSALGNQVTPDFFHTLAIPLLAGRDFTIDDAKGKAPVYIVDESLATRYFGTIDVIGKRLATNFVSSQPDWGQIVGVVGNVHQIRLSDPKASPKPEVYAPFFQAPRIFGLYLLVRSNGDPLALIPALQDRIWSVDRNEPITAVATLSQRIAETHVSSRSQTILLGIFASFGFLLALVGIYGVVSYLVSLQTREIGIRMAFGAVPAQILRRVLTHCIKLAFAGVVLGIVSGLFLSRFLSTLLFAVSPTDPLTYASVAVFLLVIALAAAYVPAHRASSVDPMAALRHE